MKYLFLITAFALLLRISFITSTPPSLNWDEVSHGYNAFSIFKTGKDEWGTSLPTIFRAFGDYKLPVYIYLTVPAVALFGLNSFSVRIVSVLAGSFAIAGTFLLFKTLFPNDLIHKIKVYKHYLTLAGISAVVLSVLPWHFFLSRPALEANLFLTLIIFGFFFLLKAKSNQNYLLPSSLFLSLSLHTYNTARVFVILMILATFVIFRFRPRLSLLSFLSSTLILLSIALVIYQIFTGTGVERYNKLKILSESAVHQIGQTRLASTLPSPLPKLLYNRPVHLVTTIGKNYLRYFTPAFFNQSSGAQSQFAIPGKNMLTLPGMILFYLGLALAIIRCRGDKPLLFILAWLTLAPLAASFTADPPQALRPIPMILPTVALISLSVIRLSRQNKHLFSILILMYFIFSTNYFYGYFSSYAKDYSASWQYGMEQAVSYQNEHRGEYSKVFITKRYGEPHLFYAFYSQLDPSILQSPSQTIRFPQSDWYWTDRIGETYFVNDWDIPTSPVNQLKLESGGKISTQNSLLITSYDHVPINSHLLKTIDFLDGKPAIKIVSLP